MELRFNPLQALFPLSRRHRIRRESIRIRGRRHRSSRAARRISPENRMLWMLANQSVLLSPPEFYALLNGELQETFGRWYPGMCTEPEGEREIMRKTA